MIEFAGVAGLGFLLGLRHATDADHVVAVTTIVAREPHVLRAARIGGLWGVGHTLALLVCGGLIIAFRLTLPPRLGLSLEMLVAVMLVALGIWNLRFRADGDAPAVAPAGTPAKASVLEPAHGHRSLLVGTIHGLAGSAAVALLALSTIEDPWWGAAYLLVFGVGTIAGMMLVTTALAAPGLLLGSRVAGWERRLRAAAGALSIVFGVLLARELIVDGQLFGATPVWDPH